MIVMQIFVAIQQALDWGASTKDFRIDPVTQDVVVSFARYRISSTRSHWKSLCSIAAAPAVS